MPLNMFKPSSNVFTDSSKAVVLCGSFLLFMFRVLSLLCCLVRSLQPCDHLLGKG